jgi:hypothetical protein
VASRDHRGVVGGQSGAAEATTFLTRAQATRDIQNALLLLHLTWENVEGAGPTEHTKNTFRRRARSFCSQVLQSVLRFSYLGAGLRSWNHQRRLRVGYSDAVSLRRG